MDHSQTISASTGASCLLWDTRYDADTITARACAAASPARITGRTLCRSTPAQRCEPVERFGLTLRFTVGLTGSDARRFGHQRQAGAHRFDGVDPHDRTSRSMTAPAPAFSRRSTSSGADAPRGWRSGSEQGQPRPAAARSAVLMRSCQPGPSAWKCSSTASSMRSVTLCRAPGMAGAFGASGAGGALATLKDGFGGRERVAGPAGTIHRLILGGRSFVWRRPRFIARPDIGAHPGTAPEVRAFARTGAVSAPEMSR